MEEAQGEKLQKHSFRRPKTSQASTTSGAALASAHMLNEGGLKKPALPFRFRFK
jgi:hypothetical protein